MSVGAAELAKGQGQNGFGEILHHADMQRSGRILIAQRCHQAVVQLKADKREGRREEALPGLSTAERDELSRLRRENRQLRLERDILSKAAAWFARAVPSGSSGS